MARNIAALDEISNLSTIKNQILAWTYFRPAHGALAITDMLRPEHFSHIESFKRFMRNALMENQAAPTRRKKVFRYSNSGMAGGTG